MSKINDLLVTESEKYVSALLTEKLPENIVYHNFDHALRVKNYAETIGKQSGLSPDEMNIIRICALFHETGYIISCDNYIEESIRIASEFLSGHEIDQQNIDKVSGTIKSIKQAREPMDKLSEVLCDADMMYIASEGGLEQFDLMYEESALMTSRNIKRVVFERKYITQFKAHTYFTEYGKTELQPRKEHAVKRMEERLKRRKLIENNKDKQGKFVYSRGVETLFRLTARNQINLNSIADNKSNILISVNAIIISIIITMLAGNIGHMSMGIVPIVVFLVICLVTIIIAIMSTRPIIISSKFSREDIKQKKVDLIFFGNFIKMDFDDYLDSIKEMIKDDDHLYSTLIKNQYSLGKILDKKFRLVKIAYNVFMIGIIITVVLFLLDMTLHFSPS